MIDCFRRLQHKIWSFEHALAFVGGNWLFLLRKLKKILCVIYEIGTVVMKQMSSLFTFYYTNQIYLLVGFLYKKEKWTFHNLSFEKLNAKLWLTANISQSGLLFWDHTRVVSLLYAWQKDGFFLFPFFLIPYFCIMIPSSFYVSKPYYWHIYSFSTIFAVFEYFFSDYFQNKK